MTSRCWPALAAMTLALFATTASAQRAVGNLAPRPVEPGTMRIVNGVPADIAEHPWQTQLIVVGPDGGKNLCGASVIAPRWVVTAAHCFASGVDARNSQARVGTATLSAGGDALRIEKVIEHPQFSLTGYRNDVALVKLRGDLTARMIPMATTDDRVAIGTDLEVSGWGATGESDPVSEILLKAAVPLVSNEDCNAPEAYAGQVTSRMLCAGHRDGGTDACQGDSGGPLVWRGPDGPLLVGVVSWGEGCARALRYGVYTRLAIYRGWINDVVAAEGG